MLWNTLVSGCVLVTSRAVLWGPTAASAQLVCHFGNNIMSAKVDDPVWSFNASAWQSSAQSSGRENDKRFCYCSLSQLEGLWEVVELPVVVRDRVVAKVPGRGVAL